ncbi:MAG TPA: gamma-glutamyl-gamma-aminobutyrate hydrolase family protein [Acidobacteriota bacterium]|nr:gamma-glutamyl-gamma-aminobutyrate hydrolase family protein [Acidobacteriota bacterium]
MRKAALSTNRLIAVIALALLSLLVAADPLACQVPSPAPAPVPERYLDSAPDASGAVRLAIFNPEVFNIRALAELRKQKILDIPDLIVVGVYHVKQRDDFSGSRKYVAENRLDWFKFHAVTAEVSEPALFRTNAATPDLALILKKTDGLIFFGGPDIPASVYGEKTSLFTEITDPFRHYLEVSAAFQLLGGSQDPKFKPLLAARPDFAVLAICLGFQTLNVGTGGTLIQDIRADAYGKTTVEDVIALGPEQWHTNPYRALFPLDKLMGYSFHSLQLGDGSVFVKEMGFKSADHPRILSAHHQAIGKMGQDLLATASSRDGRIIEAVEHRTFKSVLGVQFHPEHSALWDPEPRFGMKPGEERTSLLAILEGTPPSLAFNKAIWAWFASKLVAAHGK